MKTMLKCVLCAFVAALAASCCCNRAAADCESDRAAAVLDNLMTRTSIRAFTDQPVEAEQVELLLRAGMAAPTAVNKQPWAFVVVQDRAALDQLREVHPNARMLASAQLAIVVCGDMEKALEGTARDFWVQDASAATENILLAAHALGLGAVWCGVYPSPDRVAAVSEVLGLPGSIVPLNIVTMGYPAAEVQPKDKWDPARIHYQQW